MMRLLSWFLHVPGGIITSPQNIPCEAHLPERQSQRAAGWHGDGNAHLQALRLGRGLRPVPSHAFPLQLARPCFLPASSCEPAWARLRTALITEHTAHRAMAAEDQGHLRDIANPTLAGAWSR